MKRMQHESKSWYGKQSRQVCSTCTWLRGFFGDAAKAYLKHLRASGVADEEGVGTRSMANRPSLVHFLATMEPFALRCQLHCRL